MDVVYHAIQLPLFPTRTCYKCHAEKFLEEFSKDRSQANGQGYLCRACTSIKSHEYRQKHYVHRPRTRGKPDAEGYKVCVDCQERKPLEEFEKGNTECGRGARCIPCKKIYLQRQSATYHEAHRENINDRKRQWRKERPEQITEYSQNRRARLRQVTTTRVDYKRILERDGYWCYICEDTVAPDQVGYDHVIPITRGGAHSEENIKVTHRICNNRKNNHLLEEMLPYQRRGVR